MRSLVMSAISIAVAFSVVSGVAAADRDRDGKRDGTVSEKVDSAKKKVTGELTDREQDPVKAAQKALKARGYEIGDVDGKLGPKTRAAVQAFQKDEGIRVTGRLDTDTMARLRAGKADDRPSASPATTGQTDDKIKPGGTERERTDKGADALGNSPKGEMAKDLETLKQQQQKK